MSPVPAGLLLPQDTLNREWFLVLAMAVAFNTLIYLGLTVAKLLPWPAQVHPRRVRALLPASRGKAGTMRAAIEDATRPVADPYRQARLDAARESIPQALALVGGVIVVVAVLNSVFNPEGLWVSRLVSVLIAVTMFVLALVFGRSRVPAVAMIWTWTILTTAFAVKLALDGVLTGNDVNLTYAIIVLVLSPTLTMRWGPAILIVLVDGAAFVMAAVAIGSANALPATMAAVAAAGAGLVMLQLRLDWADRLTGEQLRSERLTTTDPLTGALSREGILLLAPSMASAAESAGGEVYACLVDVDDLGTANADYGLAYGDAVLAAVARAVSASAPRGALVARWSSDSFLVLGAGTPPDRAAFQAGIGTGIAQSGVTLGKKPITVTAGIASGPARDSSVDALIERATASMART